MRQVMALSWSPWLQCIAIAAAFVLLLHCGKAVNRNDRATIIRRTASTAAACCVTWLPLWTALKAHKVRGALHTANRRTLLRRDVYPVPLASSYYYIEKAAYPYASTSLSRRDAVLVI